MIEKLTNLVKHYELIVNKMSDPKVVSDIEKYTELAKEHRQLTPIIDMSKQYISLYNNIKDDEEILLGDDVELKEIVKEEISDFKKELKSLEEKLKIKLLPKDPNDDKNIILEIRSGTGGNEASLFANDLFRMYARYSEDKKWNIEVLSINENEGGGIKEVVISVQGNGAFGYLKYESGVHRVQRIPETESNGRVHTSAATVAVLPEAEEVDIDIQETDIKIDTYRASGAGGQHVNKTESAIRLTHIPTGLVVTCQDESSQHKNKASAMKVLRSRLFALEQEKLNKDRDEMRKSLVSTGDRSAKIRTYNFPQGRITDHRINYTTHKLQVTLEGELDHLIEQLKLAEDSAKIE